LTDLSSQKRELELIINDLEKRLEESSLRNQKHVSALD